MQLDNLFIIIFSLIVKSLFSSGTHVGDSSISIEYDENAAKAKRKRRVPSLIVVPPVACQSNIGASSTENHAVLNGHQR